MEIFTHVYKHFYDELIKAYIKLIDEYGIDKTLDIKCICEAYNCHIIDKELKSITYHTIEVNNQDQQKAVHAFVEFNKADDTIINIFNIPLIELIAIYESVSSILLCIEYGIDDYNKNGILKVLDEKYNNKISADIKLCDPSGINENTSTLDHILRVLMYTQNKKYNIPFDNEMDENNEYIKNQFKVKLSLYKKDDSFIFNVKHEIFDIDLDMNKLSGYEILSMYDLIMKNKK